MGYLLRFFVLLARLAKALLAPNREGYLRVNERGAHWVKPGTAAASHLAGSTSESAPAEPSPELDLTKLEQASPEERKAAIEFLAQVAVDRIEGHGASGPSVDA